MKRIYGVCSQHVDIWGRNLGDESRGGSEAVSHIEKNAENAVE
jgi:hypothetical protein